MAGCWADNREGTAIGDEHEIRVPMEPLPDVGTASLASVLPRLAITGASGAIGRVLRRGLEPEAAVRRLVDVRPPSPPAGSGEEVVLADLRDLDATTSALLDCEAVVHLAAIPHEAGFEEILDGNVRTTYHVLEAARDIGVRRVVFASSNHATGFLPTSTLSHPGLPPRPDTFYGVSKVAGEALGSMYADKHGLEVVCVRIGSFLERPTELRHLANWLSPGDAVRLFRACLSAPDVGFRIVYGCSGNTHRCYDLSGAFELGYRPADDAEAYAAELALTAPDRDADPTANTQRYQGGIYTEPGPLEGMG